MSFNQISYEMRIKMRISSVPLMRPFNSLDRVENTQAGIINLAVVLLLCVCVCVFWILIVVDQQQS